jgi:chitin disaccharide deacetylase
MTAQRLLIVNADDFGISPGVNAGIIQAHEQGIVTSTSLMVRQPAVEEATRYARGNPRLGLGLHVDLGEWIYRDWQWHPVYQRVPMLDAAAVEAEVRAQLQLFRELMGREPDHIDSHQHVHRRQPAAGVLERVGRELGLPVRGQAPRIAFCGDFYGQGDDGLPVAGRITRDGLLSVLDTLGEGATELACHPGLLRDTTELGHTMYRQLRDDEVSVLCDPALPEALAARGLRCVTYAQAVQLLGGAW